MEALQRQRSAGGGLPEAGDRSPTDSARSQPHCIQQPRTGCARAAEGLKTTGFKPASSHGSRVQVRAGAAAKRAG